MNGALSVYGHVCVLDFDGVITELGIDWGLVKSVVSSIAGFKVLSLAEFFREHFRTELFFRVSNALKPFELGAAMRARPSPCIGSVLKVLKEGCLSLYLASLQCREVLDYFLSKHHLGYYFTEVFSREGFPSKREVFKHLLELWGLPPASFLVIDDSARNITYCRELGMKCLYVRGLKGSQILGLVRGCLYGRY